MLKKLFATVTGMLCAVLACVPAMATMNPQTGDLRGQMLWIVLGIGGVALVVVIVMTAMGGKKKKKK